jgi:hypothetical protein
MLTLFIYDKKELETGIKKEMEEHGMSHEEATKTAKDHLKENPHYYSIADSVGLEDEEVTESKKEKKPKYKSGFGRGKMGSSKHAQGIPSGKNFPFTQKSGRLWKIKAAAKKGPVVAVGAGFGGPAEGLEKE